MHELMIDLDDSLRKPLYRQIYDYIRSHIADGKISCGEKLPSTRLLAAHLQISRSTVSLAYEQLLSEGYLEARRGSGYYASDISELYVGGRTPKKPLRKAKWDGQRLDSACGVEQKYRIVFSPEENDFSQFPYAAWRKLSRELLAVDDPTLFQAGEAAGELTLREAICTYLYHARGVNCTPDQLIIGAGNEYLLMLLMQILGGKRKVAMENPTYRNAYGTLAQMGCDMVLTGMDANGMKTEEIKRHDPDIVYTMPSHQFPTGIVMPLKRRLELLSWAMERPGRYIIEDDYDSEFRYKGKPIPSLQGNDAHGTVIYIGTFSKSISPSIRVSYMALPDPLLRAYHANCGFYASTVPKEQQNILAAFLKQGYFERHLNKMRRIYKAKHDLFLSLLKKESWVQKIYGDYAGMHLLVEVKTQKSAARIVDQAKANGVRAYDLEEYRIFGTKRREGAPTLLLGYGALEEDAMREGISILRRVVREENDN